MLGLSLLNRLIEEVLNLRNSKIEKYPRIHSLLFIHHYPIIGRGFILRLTLFKIEKQNYFQKISSENSDSKSSKINKNSFKLSRSRQI